MYHFFLKGFSRVIFIFFKGTICYFKLILTGIYLCKLLLNLQWQNANLKMKYNLNPKILECQVKNIIYCIFYIDLHYQLI
jgi:hypothetical protein